jgi:hypothetical protein
MQITGRNVGRVGNNQIETVRLFLNQSPVTAGSARTIQAPGICERRFTASAETSIPRHWLPAAFGQQRQADAAGADPQIGNRANAVAARAFPDKWQRTASISVSVSGRGSSVAAESASGNP